MKLVRVDGFAPKLIKKYNGGSRNGGTTMPATANTSHESPPAMAPSKKSTAGKMRLTCPHCKSPARVRHSRELAPAFRDGIAECQNIEECGWRVRFTLEFVATLTPSACPNSEVDIPQSTYVLPSSPHALPPKLKAQNLNPQHVLERDQLDLFTLH